MDRNLSQLITECALRGIDVSDAPAKAGKKFYLDKLAENSLSKMEKVSWGLRQRLAIESPMLCFTFKHLKEHEQKNVMTSPNWIAERKLDGCRLIVTYHPDEGFGFFSRNVSVTDFLPVDYTDQILLIKDGKCFKASMFKGMFKSSFVLDAEVVCRNKNVNTALYSKAGVVTGTELNAACAILALNQKDSHDLQMTQGTLTVVVFDALQFADQNLAAHPLRNRIEWRDKLVTALKNKGMAIELVDSSNGSDKEDFYQQLLAEGSEGVVLKNLEMPYLGTTSRPRTHCIKRKRSMQEAHGADIDAYVVGFVPSNEKKSWSHLIGAFEMAVRVRKTDGQEYEHRIAAIGAMPLELREQATVKGPDGKPTLNPEFIGKVLTINGQDLSARQHRFTHASHDWKQGWFRVDKNASDCVVEEEFLLSQVL